MSFVSSAGRVLGVHQPPGPFVWGFGGTRLSDYITLSDGVHRSYEQLYRSQPALRTVIGFLARNVASLRLHTYEQRRDNDPKRLPDHPLARLLRNPLPGTKWTQYRLFSWTMHELCLFDDAFWVKTKIDGGRLGLLPVPRRFVEIDGDDWASAEGYWIGADRGRVRVQADQVVHFHGYNPNDMRVGVPPAETLRQVLAEEWAANNFREQMWRNGARVSGYLERPEKAPVWTDQAKERFKQQWQSQYSGMGPATGGTPILEDGMKFVGSGVSPKDAQYIEARRLTREECAVAYFLNPMIVGLMDAGATQGSFTVLHRMLYQDGLGPWLAQIAEDIAAQLLPDLDATGAESGDVFCEFNLAEKLRGSFEDQAAALQTAVGRPWMTAAEARAQNNLPFKEGTDELIVPLNVSKGGLASPTDTAPESPTNNESNGQLPAPKPPKAALAGHLLNGSEVKL